jgi:hypothetical protein
MNDDIRILSMLLRFSQRRMVAVVEQVYAHVGSGNAVRLALARLERQGLIYSEGPSLRLTMAGLATAVAVNAGTAATVHSIVPPRPSRPRAA